MPARTCAFAQACLRTGPSESVPTDREGLLPARTGRLPRNRLTPACSVWRRPRWRFRMLYRPLSTGALERLSSTAGAAIAKREKSRFDKHQAIFHRTRLAGSLVQLPPPARTGSRSPILVGLYSEAPVCKQTVRTCKFAPNAFLWFVHSPFSFVGRKENGVDCPAIIMAPSPVPSGRPLEAPLWNRFVKIKSTPAS